MKNLNQIAKQIIEQNLEGYHGTENIWGIALMLDYDLLDHPQYGDGEALIAEWNRAWDELSDEDEGITISESIKSIPEGLKFITEDEMNAILTHGATTH